jgi:hypothetical protein
MKEHDVIRMEMDGTIQKIREIKKKESKKKHINMIHSL